MANKGISEVPLFDPTFQKMDCPLFGVTTVSENTVKVANCDYKLCANFGCLLSRGQTLESEYLA